MEQSSSYSYYPQQVAAVRIDNLTSGDLTVLPQQVAAAKQYALATLLHTHTGG